MRSSTVSLLASAALAAALGAQEPAPSAPTPAADPASPAPAPPARPESAAALFAAFAGMEGLEARFEEEKHLALLAVPLKSAGRLYFLPPGYLARVVESPERSTLRITPDELRVEGREGVERIDLRRSDDVRVFVTSLVQVFSGDRVALERSYDVRYGPDPEAPEDEAAWELVLTPKRKPLTEMMKELRLRGAALRVRAIEVIEPTGDRTSTRIVDADPARRFSAAEKERLFGIEAE